MKLWYKHCTNNQQLRNMLYINTKKHLHIDVLHYLYKHLKKRHMKRILSIIALFTIVLTACEGAPGPPGPAGFDGQNGGIITSNAFEVQVNFNINNQYQIIEPYGFRVFEYDMTLVYILWEIIDGQDVWRLLPQSTTFIDGAWLTYNFDFTQTDVKIFLEGTANFSNLEAVWTQGAVFRIVVIPADNVSGISNPEMTDFNISSFQKRY
jgi:hypothetical protein